MSTPTREQDHCTAHSDYRADCNPCFDMWLKNAEVRTGKDNDQCLKLLTVIRSEIEKHLNTVHGAL